MAKTKRNRPKSDKLNSRSDSAEHPPKPKRLLWAAVAIALVIGLSGIVAFFLVFGMRATKLAGNADLTAASFVGSETCASCHRVETELWRTSQHKQAMDHATEKSVLGNFSDVSFEYYGVRSRFFRKDGKFLVETDGPDGKLATFEVKYTYGLDPLQQYLIEFPDGRLQVLSIAWDSRPKDKGGQRWFHLYPNEQIRHDDFLHWTKLNQNWNFMCAECHSTGVRKNYDAANDRFATIWSEISVGCETCHGKGSRHVDWASSKQNWWPFGKRDDPTEGLVVRFKERDGINWSTDPVTGQPKRSIAPAILRKEVETCGLCHSRSSKISEDWVPGRWLSDTHVVSPITRDTYYADGQIRDVEEPYNYVPFKQSKMFAAGVTCSDCHEPHSAKLRASGNEVCLQCHASDKYAIVTHHHHAKASPALACTSCHMQARLYMVVDPRHDHSFRIPRPDLSVTLSTPNACNDCHADKSAQWASAAIESWFGSNRKSFQSYGTAFHAAWTEQPDAATLLAAIAADRNVPAVARASALTELALYISPANVSLARAGLTDPDPMVRIGALDMLENVSARQIWPLVSPLLSDPVLGVRITAASLLAAVPTSNQPEADREHFERAAAEFIATQRLNADRPEGRTTLGNFLMRRRLFSDAETEYKAALRLSPQYASAAINLADLYRQLGRDAEGENVLRSAIAISPEQGGLHHALGLTLTRLKQPEAALIELRRAAELEPDRARYPYVYAVALHSAGRRSDAIELLKKSLARHPGDRDTLMALISFNRDAGDNNSALEYAGQLAKITPDDQELTRLIQELRSKPTAK